VGDIRIGWVKKAAGKGDRIRVYFPDGTSKEAIAQTDIINDKVGFVGGYAFSGNEARIISVDRPKTFKSKASYEEGGYYPYLTAARSGGAIAGLYPEVPINLISDNFPNITDINLTHLGGGLSAIALLYNGGYKATVFVDKTNPPVEKSFDTEARLSGNIAWMYKDGIFPPRAFDWEVEDSDIVVFGNTRKLGSYLFYDPWYFRGDGFLGFGFDTGFSSNSIENPMSSYSTTHTSDVTFFGKGTGSIVINNDYVVLNNSLGNNAYTLAIAQSWDFGSECPMISTDDLPRSGVMSQSGSDVMSLNCNLTTSSFLLTNSCAGSISGGYSNPIILNDFQTFYETSSYSFSRSGQSTMSFVPGSPYGAFVPTDVDTATSSLSGTRDEAGVSIIFNKGIVSLYLASDRSINESISFSLNQSGAYKYRLEYSEVIQPRPTLTQSSYSDQTQVSSTKSESYSFSIDLSCYKIAYREETILLDTPGYSFTGNAADSVISAIVQSSGIMDISALIPSISRYRSSQTVSTIHNIGTLGGIKSVVNAHTKNDAGTVDNPLKASDRVVLLTTKNNESYLSICAIADFEYTDTTENDNPFDHISSIAIDSFGNSWASRTASQVNLSLVVVKSKKIKVMYLPDYREMFGFPVKGAAVFRQFPEGRISFFEKPSSVSGATRKFLAVTMLPITATGTQSLVFEIVDNDIVFLDVMGGEVENPQVDATFANQWVQFFPDSVPEYWA
jgi:hypothetical protein